MTANVRCAGKDTVVEMSDSGKYDRVIQRFTEPCGWTGERYAMGILTEQEATLPAWSTQWRAAVDRADVKARTAKPCPRCYGKVELIPAEDRP